ncbi:hypothetical protein GCM10027589_14830 [Actinocorallia lasiicapitis]
MTDVSRQNHTTDGHADEPQRRPAAYFLVTGHAFTLEARAAQHIPDR